jgi:hypothetical protein
VIRRPAPDLLNLVPTASKAGAAIAVREAADMHDNLDMSQTIRLPPQRPSTPKREHPEGQEDDSTEYVLGPVFEQHLEQDGQEGDPNHEGQ